MPLTQTAPSTYNRPTNESVRPWATEIGHHRYNSAFAPCFPYTTLHENAEWFQTLGSVNKIKILDQMFEELVHCANVYFDNSSFGDAYSGKPKFVDNLGWLITLYNTFVSPVESLERLAWVNDLHLLCLTTFVDNDDSLFDATRGVPAFMRGVQCVSKQRIGLYWHLYRFQVETRAKRNLSAEEYRKALGRIRMDGQRHTLQWNALQYVNQDYRLYPQTLGNARRSNDVTTICDLIRTDPIMTAGQTLALRGNRDAFFDISCRTINRTVSGVFDRLTGGGTGIQYTIMDRLVFENPN